MSQLSLNKQVFTRGETLNLTVQAKVDVVQVSLYSSEKLFLNYEQKANTSKLFTVDSSWSFGFWNISAKFSETPITSFFTILNDDDCVNALYVDAVMVY